MINNLLNIVLVADDIPIMSDGNGGIDFHLENVYAPEYGSYGEDFVHMIEYGINGWSAVRGFTRWGKDAYIMSSSETIGNAMENYILDTPGYYAIETISSEYDDGWILMRKPL